MCQLGAAELQRGGDVGDGTDTKGRDGEKRHKGEGRRRARCENSHSGRSISKQRRGVETTDDRRERRGSINAAEACLPCSVPMWL